MSWDDGFRDRSMRQVDAINVPRITLTFFITGIPIIVVVGNRTPLSTIQDHAVFATMNKLAEQHKFRTTSDHLELAQ